MRACDWLYLCLPVTSALYALVTVYNATLPSLRVVQALLGN